MKLRKLIIALACFSITSSPVFAVEEAEDIATTIKLRGYDCPSREVQSLVKQDNPDGSKQVDAICNNGKRYRITVDTKGRLRVTPR